MSAYNARATYVSHRNVSDVICASGLARLWSDLPLVTALHWCIDRSPLDVRSYISASRGVVTSQLNRVDPRWRNIHLRISPWQRGQWDDQRDSCTMSTVVNGWLTTRKPTTRYLRDYKRHLTNVVRFIRLSGGAACQQLFTSRLRSLSAARQTSGLTERETALISANSDATIRDGARHSYLSVYIVLFLP